MEEKKTVYTCPMHPEIRREQPGMCPECGMSLLSQKEKTSSPEVAGHDGIANHASRAGHGASASAGASSDKHAGHRTSDFLKKFWISMALTIPVVIYSDFVMEGIGWEPPAFPGILYLPLMLSSIVFFYGGGVFLIGAWKEVRARMPGMMTLIALAMTAAYAMSVYATFVTAGETLFWELTTLITVMLLGHWIEMKAVSGAQGALRELSRLLPDTAEVIREGSKQIVTVSELKEGDLVFVRPGARIPADGRVTEGDSDVNEALVTGESKPSAKHAGSEVIAGTVNGDGSLSVRITKAGEKTFLAGIMRLVAQAQASKSRLQIMSDRAAYYLTIIAVSAGFITFLFWLRAGSGMSYATERLVAVLVIACPHALGLTVPLVASISTTMAARHGFLVRARIALEHARNITTVLFDKTGTLTKGEYGVDRVWNVAAQNDNHVVQLAASVDAHSEHFIAKAIVGEARMRGTHLLNVKDFSRIPGKGVRGTVEGSKITIGGNSLFDGKLPTGISVIASSEIDAENEKGKTIIYILRNGSVLGVLSLADIIREESREAISQLKESGVKVAMITGDSEGVASWVAQSLGIDEYFSNVLPHQKAEKVEILQAKGEKVAMVGDGINDAPALMSADLGIAIGAGTNAAIESAGIILVRNDPRDIVKIIKLSRLTYSKMIQNLFWATGYNIIALPLAAGAFAAWGIIMQPAFSAVLMSLSTVIVSINAVLMRRREL